MKTIIESKFAKAIKSQILMSKIYSVIGKENKTAEKKHEYINTHQTIFKKICKKIWNIVKPIFRPFKIKLEKLLFFVIDNSNVNVKVDDIIARLHKLESKFDKIDAGLESKFDKIDNCFTIALRRHAFPIENNYLIRCKDEWLLAPTEDLGLIAGLIENGELEPGTRAVAEKILDEGNCVIDVGANVGLMTVPLARKVGPKGFVFAMEPVPRAYDLLNENVLLNGLSKRVDIFKLAIGCCKKNAKMNIVKTIGHCSLVDLCDENIIEKIDVEVVSLDEIIPVGQKINLVKIDVEGYEIEVLNGMGRVLSENPDIALIVEFGPLHLNRVGMSTEKWLSEFLLQGFLMFAIDEVKKKVKPLNIIDLKDVYSVNLLMVKNEEILKNRDILV